MARINEQERIFRINAGLCMRCGFHPRIEDRCICANCAAEDLTRVRNKRLTELDRAWATKRAVA